MNEIRKFIVPSNPINRSYTKAEADAKFGSAGSGDVVGPASAVDSNFAAFDTTTGKLIKDSGSKAADFAAAVHTHALAAGATDVTASAAELNILDGATLSTTELNYVDGVTSAIQTQLDAKVDENGAIVGATKTKITYDAKGLVTAGADATTADIADSANKRYVTDAQLTVIGNTSGTNTGDQSSVATLTTPRAIYGNNFDGSAALTQVIASTYGGTGNGFTKFTGPTTAEKTFTLPDASSTLLYSGGALGTPSGGTLTNCTGLPVNGIVDDTTSALGVGTLELGHASDTTLSRSAAGTLAVEGVDVLTTSNTKTVSNKTLSGAIPLEENASIDLDPALSADGKYSGICITGTAGAALAFGDLIYLAAADSRWELADADAATTADRMLGICVLAAAADGNATKILLHGNIRADAAFPALTIGSPVYVGETAGDVQVAIPTGADNIIRRVGYALTADELYFCPSMDSQVTVA